MLIWGGEGAQLGEEGRVLIWGGCSVRRGKEGAHLRGGKESTYQSLGT